MSCRMSAYASEISAAISGVMEFGEDIPPRGSSQKKDITGSLDSTARSIQCDAIGAVEESSSIWLGPTTLII